MNLANVTVSRTIPAAAETVFDVWLDSKSPEGPWRGAERVILNPIVDGLFYLAVKHEGRVWPHYGRFLRIDRPRCVHSPGFPKVPGVSSRSFSSRWNPRATYTEVTLHHSGMPDDETALGHKEGWMEVLFKLSEPVTSSTQAPPDS